MLISPQTLKQWLHDGQEIALLDVREHGQYGEAHLFYVVSVPYSNLESQTTRLVPRLKTRIVLVDETGQDLAELAASRLQALGYCHLHILEGGIQGWKRAGFELFAGVNLPSKTFGELAEHSFQTPRISAIELNDRIKNGENIIVLDGRPFPEYKKMSIPTAICCPNGELPLRINDLVPDERTTIIINCAGRTRSIIGAQTLINLGVTNTVLALENGTQGWYLADLKLEHGQTRRHSLAMNLEKVGTNIARARALALKHNVSFIDSATAQAWLNDESRSTYLCDVRSPEEFSQGSLTGAQSTPGGQLVQATDQFIGTRGARLILFDNDDARAPAMASWLAMMGWEVAVLDDALNSKIIPAPVKQNPLPCVATMSPQDALIEIKHGALLIDLRSSTDFRKSHIAGAVWSIRPKIPNLIKHHGVRRIVLISPSASIAQAAALDFAQAGCTDLSRLTGTPQAWEACGFILTTTPNDPPDSESIDYLFFVHDRHDGNKAAARQYLAWETNLLSQIDEQERKSFRLPH